MSGGGGPSQTTVTQSNIPDWLRPQVETVLGGATRELFKTREIPGVDGAPSTYEITGTKPFVPYSARPEDYVAGFSPLQQQVQFNAANLQVPQQFQQGTGLAQAAGMGGIGTAGQAAGYGSAGYMSGMQGQRLGQMAAQRAAQQAAQAQRAAYGYGGMGAGYGGQAAGLAPQAQLYGQTAADIGQMALQAQRTGQDIGRTAQDYARLAATAGQRYTSEATSPLGVARFMSPYTSAVTDAQVAAAQRQADIARVQRQSQAARAGAFGGSRQAIEQAEADRALATQLDTIRATGLQQAYDKAVQAQQFGANLGLQGLGSAQTGLGTALQGGQLGLSGIGQAMAGQQAGLAGLGQAGQLYGLGMQGAGLGLQGTGQAISAGQLGLQGAGVGLQGTGQGIQGAQAGLQGVTGQQAGYGLANQAAQNLGQLGQQQLAAQTGILGLQNQLGAQQQAQQQQIINQAIQNYAQAREAPMQAMQQYNALLRGYAVPGTTTTQYQATPSLASQAAGLGMAGYGLSGLMGGGKKAGGTIKESDGVDTLALRNALKG
jgi:hypothetical protein